MKRKSGQNPEITKNWKPATLAIRGGTARTEYGETSEALFLSSGYCYDRAEDAAARAEEAAAAASGRRGAPRKKRARAKVGDDGEKVDGRAGPKSECIVLQKSECPSARDDCYRR